MMNDGKSTNRKVCFNDSVSVVSIPSRDAYSSRIRNKIWESISVIRDNIKRNRFEFSAENWNWWQVYEEDEFVFCVETGNMAHPAYADLFLAIEIPAYDPFRHKNRFLQLSRENEFRWQLLEKQRFF